MWQAVVTHDVTLMLRMMLRFKLLFFKVCYACYACALVCRRARVWACVQARACVGARPMRNMRNMRNIIIKSIT